MANIEANPANFIGQPWSVLFKHFDSTKKEKPPEVTTEEIGSDGEAIIDRSKSDGWSMKLRKEDATTFGIHPTLDECYFVVCEHCGAVIKPQALYNHINNRHKINDDEQSIRHLLTQKPVIKLGNGKSKAKNSPKSSSIADTTANVMDKYSLPKPPPPKIGMPRSSDLSSSALALHLSQSTQPVVALNDVSPMNTRSHKDATPSTGDAINTSKSKSHKILSAKRSLEARLVEAEKEVSSSPPPRKLPSPSIITEIVEKAGVQRRIPSPAQSTVVSPPIVQQILPPPTKKPLSKSSSKCIPCKDREYDPDRHCGCWLDEWGKHCTRSLTCKTHALSLRRKVQGRSKPFDQLLQEHRDAKEAAQKAKALGIKPPTPQSLPTQLATSNNSSLSSPPPSSANTSKVNGSQRQGCKPAINSPFSDVEMDGCGDVIDRQFSEKGGFSSYHPRPLSVQSYGFRLSGTSFVPNRKMDFLRMAVQCAIEQQPPKKKACPQTSSIAGTGLSNGHQHTPNPSTTKSTKNKAQAKTTPTSGSKKKKKSKSVAGTSASESQSMKSLSVYAQPITVSAADAAGTSLGNINLVPAGSNVQLLRAVSSLGKTAQQYNGNKDPQQIIGQQLLLPTDMQVNGLDKSTGTFVLADVAGGKQKLANGGLQLTTNSSAIGALNKQQVVLDGLPCTLYATRQPSDQNVKQTMANQALLLKNGDLITRAANSSGIIYNAQATANKGRGAQTAILGLMPQRHNASATTSQQHLKAEAARDGSGIPTHHIIQGGNTGQVRHLTLTNGTTMRASFTPQQMLAMQQQLAKQQQQQQQTKAAAQGSLTIPLVSSTPLAQQQTLHKPGNNQATATAIPSNYS